MPRLDSITDMAHYYAGMVIKAGDTVVDATAGNGLDTIFLAQKVGSTGRVISFDIQQEALAITAGKLKAEGLEQRVDLIQKGHEFIENNVTVPLSVVMFNLGFLPGGDKRITTKGKTTISGLKQSLNLLEAGGLITIVLYPGHDEGKNEKAEVLATCKILPAAIFAVLHVTVCNRANNPPELVVIQKNLFGDR